MNAERRRQISQLFRAALAQDASERAAFLTNACGADDELRGAIESLLAHQDSAEQLPDIPGHEDPTHTGAGSEGTPAPSMDHRRFGAYRIVRETVEANAFTPYVISFGVALPAGVHNFSVRGQNYAGATAGVFGQTSPGLLTVTIVKQ
jgi:hypothetical protein